VDDANRISGFKYIVQLLQTKRSDQNFKIIVTVRDYALYKVREICQSVDASSTKIRKSPESEKYDLISSNKPVSLLNIQ
jgi:predicted RNA-binding protein Jag